MKLSKWIAVAKHSCRVGALILLPLALAHAQPAAAPGKAAPAATSGTPAADGGAAKPAKKAAARAKAPKASEGAAAAVSGDKAPQATGKAAHAAGKPAKAAAAEQAKPQPAAPAPAQPEREQLAQAPQPALRLTGNPPPPPPTAAGDQPVCSLAEPEQPRGGRLELLGDRFGSAPVVRIAGKPARMIERRAGRISVQIPADSDGGAISLLSDGKQLACGNLVIIGKNR